jgi:hypothetical protein
MCRKMDEVFPYPPLATIHLMVRLVRLHRTSEGLIARHLLSFPLEPPNCVLFRILSYVWGTPGYPYEVLLNGHPFLVLEALYPILELICDSLGLAAYWWWIDAICINQQTDHHAVHERGLQVALMGRIYSQSERTLGWLGSALEGEPG